MVSFGGACSYRRTGSHFAGTCASDFRVVRALRSAGHDVMAMVEVAPGSEDAAVLEMATREARIFITEDRDFGQLVYAAAQPATGVILLRFPSGARAHLPAMVLDLVNKHAERLSDRFVLQPGRIRFGGSR
jgi:predicted nuclease of predicted toxin-antitoxin system